MVASTMVFIRKVTIHIQQLHKQLDEVKQAQTQLDESETPSLYTCVIIYNPY